MPFNISKHRVSPKHTRPCFHCGAAWSCLHYAPEYISVKTLGDPHAKPTAQSLAPGIFSNCFGCRCGRRISRLAQNAGAHGAGRAAQANALERRWLFFERSRQTVLPDDARLIPGHHTFLQWLGTQTQNNVVIGDSHVANQKVGFSGCHHPFAFRPQSAPEPEPSPADDGSTLVFTAFGAGYGCRHCGLRADAGQKGRR